MIMCLNTKRFSLGCQTPSERKLFSAALDKLRIWMPIAFLAVVSSPLLAQFPIAGSPKNLIIQPSDLPDSFALSGGNDLPTGGHAGLYFRPEILMATNLPAGALLGVMSSVELAPNPNQARLDFASNNSANSIRSSVGEGDSPAAGSQQDAIELSASLKGTDEVALYRVTYKLKGAQAVDYRYRLRVGNAVANLIVTGRTGDGGAEPLGLAEEARQIAERQVARLIAARR